MDNNQMPAMQLTVFESNEYRQLLEREEGVGGEAVLQELLDKDSLSNAQLMWMLRHMLYYYGSKDRVLLSAPPEKLLDNAGNLLRVAYLLIDRLDPSLDDNTRLYISTKVKQATWGLTPDIRQYFIRK